jgi:DNA (cytosine-5)-methyltransferase 1
VNPKDFVIRSEIYGIPQARHRVILLGVRSDIAKKVTPDTLLLAPGPTVKDIIGDLPKLRSGLSKGKDSFRNWADNIHKDIDDIIDDVSKHGLDSVAERMTKAVAHIGKATLTRGSNWYQIPTSGISSRIEKNLKKWYSDPRLNVVCNHETRGHIVTDLHRYLFCACYSLAAKSGNRLTPKADEFPKALAPAHANWESGHFSDRFRVQAAKRVATTVTSHISKDGHYFIHYDPTQCRSLTVREAARIQTFPDNYFFVGNRTQQYTQVGNAVPPYLARKIARIVFRLLEHAGS